MLCQADFLYDEVHQWCTYPDQVCCGERDCDGRDCNDNCEGGDFECPSPNGFFEDPKNCAKYWQCNNNIAVSHMCDTSKSIGDSKDGVCLQLHGQVFRQPKRCHSAMFTV